MGNTVMLKQVKLGAGRPKIAVSLMGKTEQELSTKCEEICALPVDIVEWRADHYPDILTHDRMASALRLIREKLGERPLLFTFRTKAEGGEREIMPEDYAALNRAAAESGLCDLIDVEMFSAQAEAVLEAVHAHRVPVIGSYHNFSTTPDEAEILSRLRQMQSMGADILKIAVMPHSAQDVLTLLSATNEMRSQYADRPLVTISMGEKGVISRLCGEFFGSAMTFGAVGKTSAPGQISVIELQKILDLLSDKTAES